MTSIPNGGKFQFNHNGTELVCGYQAFRVRHINIQDGFEVPWPYPGEWYSCGWDSDLACVFQVTAENPPQTQASLWNGTRIGTDAEAVGHGELAVIDGQRLSTNGSVIWHNGTVITPEAFNGPVWDDPHAYGYKRHADGSGPFVVRSLPSNAILREIDAQGMWERVYSLSDGPWVTGQYPGGSRVYKPGIVAHWALPALELAGPVLERDGLPYVLTAVMGAGQNPRGVMVRPWAELVSGALRGWWIPDMRHQCLQARINPAGEIVVGGCEFPGSGVITIEAIPLDRPMGLVPPETPVDPPKPTDPPVVPPQPSPVILVSTEAGVAPLLVGATAHYLPVDAPVLFYVQQDGEQGWRVASVVPTGTAPAHTYHFPVAGRFNVTAGGGPSGSGSKQTDIRTVVVTAPPPPDPPKPKPRPWWWILIFGDR